ncbi:MAG: hypothetical protein KF736_05270 [Acidobacteria bacterium]|nr:hypothetical protein [Acidobacteriota bacterium]MCW5948555.1 hypothetical protein [Pyrinomonadaceae bacterium]
MSPSAQVNHSPDFDYRLLRLLIGLVAFFLPILVEVRSPTFLESISSSYWTDARDIFVGMLFMITALMLGYNGTRNDLRSGDEPSKSEKNGIKAILKTTFSEKWMSKIAAIGAVGVALFPTDEYACTTSVTSSIHYASAALVFGVIAYFCLFPFRSNAVRKDTPKARRRAIIYVICGAVILLSMIGAFAAPRVLGCLPSAAWGTTFLFEWIALWSFGIAWVVAGKVLPGLADVEERPTLFN